MNEYPFKKSLLELQLAASVQMPSIVVLSHLAPVAIDCRSAAYTLNMSEGRAIPCVTKSNTALVTVSGEVMFWKYSEVSVPES